MDNNTSLRPSPEAAASALLVLANSDQPQGVPETLELLRSIGIDSTGWTAREPAFIQVSWAGDWRDAFTDLAISSNGNVVHFSSHLWNRRPAGAMRIGFEAIVEAIIAVAGTPDDDDLKADGSRTTFWELPTTDIELYFYAERPPARTAVQIAVGWDRP